MTHTALLIAGGALLTSVLAALLFTPTASAEERHLRDVQRLLRALEAQRRVRDARRRRETRRPATIELPQQPAPEPVAVRDERAERRAAEHLRKREAKEQAAALKAQRAAEKHERRQAEQERKAALAAEQARAEAEAPPAPPPAIEVTEDEPKRLTELPLYSWATRIETQERAPTEER